MVQVKQHNRKIKPRGRNIKRPYFVDDSGYRVPIDESKFERDEDGYPFMKEYSSQEEAFLSEEPREQFSKYNDPFTKIYPEHTTHNALKALENGPMRDKDIAQTGNVRHRDMGYPAGLRDNMGRSISLRRLENTGLVKRIKWGLYEITPEGKNVLDELNKGQVWKNKNI